MFKEIVEQERKFVKFHTDSFRAPRVRCAAGCGRILLPYREAIWMRHRTRHTRYHPYCPACAALLTDLPLEEVMHRGRLQ